MHIEKNLFDSNAFHKEAGINVRRPLMIGCSGGGGHIAAIKGIHQFLQRHAEHANYRLDLPTHKPPGHEAQQQTFSNHTTRTSMTTGMYWLHAPVIGTATRSIVSATKYPTLPSPREMTAEIANLKRNNNPDEPRPYVDMLLDVYPAGFESAAIWNILQKQDKTKELKKAVNCQPMSDNDNYLVVKNYYVDLLKSAHDNDTPYTELVSTQAMALPALCDAVWEYNAWLTKEQYNSPQVCIHQYMTDLPTQGAVHYFKALEALSTQQQSVMKLYARGMEPQVLSDNLPNSQFQGVYDIPAGQNPMVRPGFQDRQTSLHDSWSKDCTVPYKTYTPEGNYSAIEQRTIERGQTVGAIMLGSQASDDTIRYVKTLLDQGVDHIFVFGGMKENISQGIDAIINAYPQEQRDRIQERIVRLGNQDDTQMQPIMTRSKYLFIRGGGLSVMEQMDMQHNAYQIVCIHHADSPDNKLESGISWEDENVNTLIKFLEQSNVWAFKTSPALALGDLQTREDLKTSRLMRAVNTIGENHCPDKAINHDLHRAFSKIVQDTCSALLEKETPPHNIINTFSQRLKEIHPLRRIPSPLEKDLKHIKAQVADPRTKASDKEMQVMNIKLSKGAVDHILDTLLEAQTRALKTKTSPLRFIQSFESKSTAQRRFQKARALARASKEIRDPNNQTPKACKEILEKLIKHPAIEGQSTSIPSVCRELIQYANSSAATMSEPEAEEKMQMMAVSSPSSSLCRELIQYANSSAATMSEPEAEEKMQMMAVSSPSSSFR